MRKVALLLALSLAAFGQRHKLEEIDAEKPGGKLLQQALQESDPAKRAAVMEQFVTENPKGEAPAAILEQLLQIYVKANQPDKVIATGEKLLALDPDDPEAALQALKATEPSKDPQAIKKWVALTSANARKMVNTPKPAEADKAESWKNDVDYAKQVDTYSEYALYRAALEATDPKVTIDLGETLEKQNAQSEYLPKLRDRMFVAYRQMGAADKALALAEKVLATDQSNEDMLLVAADHYLQTKKSPDKVHAYSAKIIEVMASKPKPEGTSDADWLAHKNQVTGLAYYVSGKQYSVEGKNAQAEQDLRKALPLVEASPALAPIKAELLFLLAFADYKLAAGNPEKAQEAANYFRACAALKSPYQATAATNLKKIMAEYHGIK